LKIFWRTGVFLLELPKQALAILPDKKRLLNGNRISFRSYNDMPDEWCRSTPATDSYAQEPYSCYFPVIHWLTGTEAMPTPLGVWVFTLCHLVYV